MIYISFVIAFLGTAYAGKGPFDTADLDRYATFYSSEFLISRSYVQQS
jgi:hypothetical protein